ncbi:MAG: extracellular solute-binding protein [Anaerolineales bacterium]
MNRRQLVTLVMVLIVFSLSCQSIPFLAHPTSTPTATPTRTPTPRDSSIPAEDTPEPEVAQPTPTVEEAGPVVITWWHTTTQKEWKAVWRQLADEFMALHPNVTIEIRALEIEAFKAKLAAAMRADDPPDIFQSWGGVVLNEYAEAGLLRDITPELDADGGAWRNTFGIGALGVYAYKGANYGAPWDMGMIGWWYNKALLLQAGIEIFPATWSEFTGAVTKLKNAGITPIAVGLGDKWPGMFYYMYLVARIGGRAAFEGAMLRSGSFADEPFVRAGEMVRDLVNRKPFQDGFLGATYGDEATIMGDGLAAMELMGQWAPSVNASFSADGEGIGDDLDWAPFPAVAGGAGDPNDAAGGGNGFAIGRDAPDAAVDFVKYLTRPESQMLCAADGWCLPVVAGGETAMTDPLMIKVQRQLALAKYLQLYYDHALPPALGGAVNSSVQALFAGTMTPEECAQAIEDSAQQELD